MAAAAAAVPTVPPVPLIERRIPLPLGDRHICARIWNCASVASPDALPAPRPHDTHLLLLHGWLDNAASWDRIVPHLCAHYPQSRRARAHGASSDSPSRLVCYALELSGHGDSSHRSPGGSYHPSEHAIDMLSVVDALGVPPGFFLCGHSLGGAVAYIMSTAYTAEQCAGLVLVDSIGPWSAPGWMSDMEVDPSILRLSFALQEHAANGRARLPKLYQTKEAIVQRYIHTNPFMEEESARVIAERAVKEVWQHAGAKRQVDVGTEGAAPEPLKDGEWKRGWAFKHDSRLVSSALLTPLEENTLSAFSLIPSPVLVFLATNRLRKEVYTSLGRDPRRPAQWPLPESHAGFDALIARRLSAMRGPVALRMVEGDHHIHMDSASAADLAGEMLRWMDEPTRKDAAGPVRLPRPTAKL